MLQDPLPDWILYQLIDKHPGESIYALSKAIGWSTGKVYASVKRLAEDGMVRIERSMKGGRSVLVVEPLEWQEFFTPKELDELEKMEFNTPFILSCSQTKESAQFPLQLLYQICPDGAPAVSAADDPPHADDVRLQAQENLQMREIEASS